MIAVLIGIIVLIAVIIVCVGVGFLLGFIGGTLFATDEIMDDPYLRATALRVMGENDGFYKAWHAIHGTIKERINEKL